MVRMHLELPRLLDQIVRELHAAGYRAVVVGGAVRDPLLIHELGGEPKDFDIEVYGIAYDRLAGILARHGRVDLVGKSFGVVKLVARDNQGGHEYDFSGGLEHLKNRVLRATSDAFAEDPLRVLRGMQFACRFDLTLEPGTAGMCQSIVDHYATIARERVADEFMKWAVKSPRPGRIAAYLKASGWDVHFPEIGRLAGVPQDPGWHPEGDVGTHTMFVVDAAARIAFREDAREKFEGDDRAVLIFAALCHDFAKATTTMQRER